MTRHYNVRTVNPAPSSHKDRSGVRLGIDPWSKSGEDHTLTDYDKGLRMTVSRVPGIKKERWWVKMSYIGDRAKTEGDRVQGHVSSTKGQVSLDPERALVWDNLREAKSVAKVAAELQRAANPQASQPWIQREGKLGGPGYTRRSQAERRKLLEKCMREYGYRSCLGSIMVLQRNRNIAPKTRKVLESDQNWLVDTYGRRSNPTAEIVAELFVVQGKPLRLVTHDWQSDPEYADEPSVVDAYQVNWSNHPDPLKGWLGDIQQHESGLWTAGDNREITYASPDAAAADVLMSWLEFRETLTQDDLDRLWQMIIPALTMPRSKPPPSGLVSGQSSRNRNPTGVTAPSAKRLLESFRDLEKSDANLIRAFAKAVDDRDKLEELVDKVPATKQYVSQMHSSPYRSSMWRRTVMLHAINELLGGYGVEAILDDDLDDGYGRAPQYEYINFGDTYALTIIFDSLKDRLFLGTWGDIVENQSRSGNPTGSDHLDVRAIKRRLLK